MREVMDSMRKLGEQLATAASLAWSFELGERAHERRVCSIEGSTAFASAPAYWYPGCGLGATQPMIACAWCAMPYLAFNVEARQAHRCAASCYQRDGVWYLTGHYGSHLADLILFRWNDYPPWLDGKALDPVCDDCIEKLVTDGTLIALGETSLEGELIRS
jgi:hypothetical protein